MILSDDSTETASSNLVPAASDGTAARAGIELAAKHPPSIDAVSYTHLDVYKRQIRTLSISNM